MGGRGSKKKQLYLVNFNVIYTYWNGQTVTVPSQKMSLGGDVALDYIMEVNSMGWASFFQVGTAWRIDAYRGLPAIYEWRSRLYVGSGWPFQRPRVEVTGSKPLNIEYYHVISDPTWHLNY